MNNLPSRSRPPRRRANFTDSMVVQTDMILVMPFSHEQPDNAARSERLGVAGTIAHTSYTAERAAALVEAPIE